MTSLAVGIEGELAGEHVIKRDAEAVEIGAEVDVGLVRVLLGGRT